MVLADAVIDTPPAESAGLPFRHVMAVASGNALAFYDFLTYAFFAVQIGKDSGISLLLTLGTFMAGFFTRPLGALVIGSLGDRYGRRPAMVLSFVLMGIGILVLALTPPYRIIGIAAPILLVFSRLLQGFALGGEVGPSTAYLIEAAPPGKRGRYTSLAFATQDLAVLVAGIVGYVLASILSTDALNDWGWRVAFLLGAAIVPFGFMLRRNLPETLERSAPNEPPVRVRQYMRVAILGFFMLCVTSVATYTNSYMTTFASATLHMRADAAFGATIVVGIFSVAFDLLGGVVSDRVGRKPPMIFAYILLLLCAYPGFLFIVHARTVAALYIVSALFSALQCLGSGPVLTAITEALPQKVRSGALSLVYALSITVFGGSTQFMITWLIRETGNPIAPGWYLSIFVAIGLVAIFMMPETWRREGPTRA
jgi:MHS family citrate/tricarballylate:H+ symporter-like MFS transporter